jgi:hypothetical protein
LSFKTPTRNANCFHKQTGHDYTGRSTGAGAFTIWTHYLDSTEAVPKFVPDGCKANNNKPAPTFALNAGPGVDVEALYKWGGENGRVTIGGTTTTVGATGGYILGGGLGMKPRPVALFDAVINGSVRSFCSVLRHGR